MSNVLYAGAALAALLYFNSTSTTPTPAPTTPITSDVTKYVPYTPITDVAPIIASPLDTGSGVTPATPQQIQSYKTGKCLMNGVQHPKLLLNNYLFWNKDAATCFQMTGAVQLPDGTYTAPVTYQNADGSITKPSPTTYYDGACWCSNTTTEADFGYQKQSLTKAPSCTAGSCTSGTLKNFGAPATTANGAPIVNVPVSSIYYTPPINTAPAPAPAPALSPVVGYTATGAPIVNVNYSFF